MSDMRHDSQLAKVAEVVYEARRAKNLTLREAARRARMASDTWNKVELQRPARSSTYARIERVLGLAPGSLDKARSGVWIVGDTPSSGAVARVATMIRAVQSDAEIPEADRRAIAATMAATLAHLREREAG